MLISVLSLLLLSKPAGPAGDARHFAPSVARQRTACELVSRAGVQQALGRAVEPGVETSSASGESTCEFASRGGRVSISLQRLRAKPDMDAELASLQGALPEAVARRIENSGNDAEAWLLCLSEAGVQIHLIHADRNYVLVSVLGLGDAGLVASPAKAIAAQALLSLRANR